MADKVGKDAYAFGQSLKRYREAAKVTQQEMADYTGLTKNYISAIERGVHKCNAQTFIAYGRKCGYSLDEMAGLVSRPNINRQLLQKLSDLSEEEQLKVMQIIELLK